MTFKPYALLPWAWLLIIILWKFSGGDTTVAVALILFGCAIQSLVTSLTLTQHHKLLEWFASHIRLDPHSIPEDMPEDLRALIGKEDDTKHITKP